MTEPTAQPALQALLDLATATRPDIDRRDLEGALVACHDAGWSWSKTLVQTALVLAHGEEPRDLRAAVADPLKLRRNTR